MDCLGGSNLGAMRLGFTLGENTGRGVGVLAGAHVGGRVLSSMWSFLLLLLDICCEEGWCVALELGLGVVERKDGEATASEKISLRRVRSTSWDCCTYACGHRPSQRRGHIACCSNDGVGGGDVGV